MSAEAAKCPEFEPPQACVGRIIKNVLPENVQLTKDARAAFTRAAGIFIFYLTTCANEFSKESKRTTIYTQDVLLALKELDFEDFEPVMNEFLEAYRKEQGTKKQVSKAKKQSSGGSGGNDDEDDDEVHDGELVPMQVDGEIVSAAGGAGNDSSEVDGGGMDQAGNF